MHLVKDALSLFTPANLLFNLIFSVILTYLGKVIAKIVNPGMVKKGAYWIKIGCVIFAAVFMAKLIAFDPPNLKINLISVTPVHMRTLAGQSVLTAPEANGVFILAKIMNTGSPTVIDGWQMRLWLRGQTNPITLTHNAVPNTFCVPSPNPTVPTLIFYGSEELSIPASETPIPKGGVARGVLFFYSENTTWEEFSTVGNRFVLSVSDLLGNWYDAEYEIPREALNYQGPYTKMPGLRSGPQRVETPCPDSAAQAQ